ncbi:MAG: hypothetical protein AVDCRST_MAG12-703, partial [uncultured Rubrobacteraceae bacterium]
DPDDLVPADAGGTCRRHGRLNAVRRELAAPRRRAGGDTPAPPRRFPHRRRRLLCL